VYKIATPLNLQSSENDGLGGPIGMKKVQSDMGDFNAFKPDEELKEGLGFV